ncbi:zinc-binding dehydrogenase [Chloroflexota bacterium]
MKTGKAAIFTKPREPFVIKELPIPEVMPGAILVKLSMSNICGSDVHAWKGETRRGGGEGEYILGHEMVGRVYQLGEGVVADSLGQPLKEGDRVVYPYWTNCQHCFFCLSGRDSRLCPNKTRAGDSPAVAPNYFNGAFAEYFYLNRGHHVFKVPDELSDEMVSPVNCAISQVMFALWDAGCRLGDKVVIQGAGGLGVAAATAAKEMGAGLVVVIDKFASRLNAAREFGADVMVSMEEFPTTRDRVREIRKLTNGPGADIVLEVAGKAAVVEEGITMVRSGGKYVWIGAIANEDKAEIETLRVIGANRTIIGYAWYEPWIMPKALDLMVKTRDKYPWAGLVTKFRLEDINEAFVKSDIGEVNRAAISFD